MSLLRVTTIRPLKTRNWLRLLLTCSSWALFSSCSQEIRFSWRWVDRSQKTTETWRRTSGPGSLGLSSCPPTFRLHAYRPVHSKFTWTKTWLSLNFRRERCRRLISLTRSSSPLELLLDETFGEEQTCKLTLSKQIEIEVARKKH